LVHRRGAGIVEAMRLTRADLLALLIALGAAITGVVVWNHGTVDLGMTLTADGQRVTVVDVTPGGNASRQFVYPGASVVEIVTTDGNDVERGEELSAGMSPGAASNTFPWLLDSFEGDLIRIEADDRWPVEVIPTERIQLAVFAEFAIFEEPFGEEVVEIYSSGLIDRPLLEHQLRQSIWIAGLLLLVGAVAWRLLAHGLAGPFGRRHALVVAAAVAVPGLILPAVQAGTPAGIAAGFLVPAAVALVLGMSLARDHPEPQWVQTGMSAALVAAGLTALVVIRVATGASISPSDPGTILLLIAALGVAPPAVAASAKGRELRERASLLSLGLVPAAAATLIVQRQPEPIWPIILVSILLGWYILPLERAFAIVGERLQGVRSIAPAVPAAPAAAAREPIVPTGFRDLLTIALFALVVFAAFFRIGSETYALIGVMLAGVVGFAIRDGFLGEQWADAAIPLGVAVGLPITIAGFDSWMDDGTAGWVSIALALAGMSVADVLAARHSHPAWRRRLLLWSLVAGAIPVVLWGIWASGANEPWAFVIASLVPLVPGLPVAFAADHHEPREVSTRLETMVVALTLGVSALVLTPLAWVPLVAWFIAIVVWRRFTLAPLLGLAQRTQLQRDLAVAAAETERARLAADLHDDALQQLTMLVRTLDVGGHSREADAAREIATKLRSVVGDLRLPILDDLGAGAALEWLVERVEPLAGGPVKLERSDEARPPANVELAVFRVAQEALTNAIKHGRAPIAVRYDVRADGRVTLAVDDAGPGIGPDAAEEAPRQGHFGLANMQQRAEQIGALLDVRRWPAGGTRVALEWRPQ
jgi:signal transduction histidine kinase